MNDTRVLERLVYKFEMFGGEELLNAAALARDALAKKTNEMRPEAEYTLFTHLWEFVSQALDHESYDPEHENEIEALEAEMAGRVLSYRLERGWLVKAENAPAAFLSSWDNKPKKPDSV
jgi:hypothetical protein